MESMRHDLNSLFEQLGLENSSEAISNFISNHKPLSHHVQLHEAEFWNNNQADFLKQAIDDDADWAIVVDQLDALLRKK